MSQGKGDKRRPCQIPQWLEVFRWARALGQNDGTPEYLNVLMKQHPNDRKYLTGEELDLLDNV
jgi:hypothetical protein